MTNEADSPDSVPSSPQGEQPAAASAPAPKTLDEFLTLKNAGLLEAGIDNTLALRLIDRLPLRYRFAYYLWGSLGLLSIPCFIAIAIFVKWWAGLLLLVVITPAIFRGTGVSAAQFVLEHAMANRDFFDLLVAKNLLIFRSTAPVAQESLGSVPGPFPAEPAQGGSPITAQHEEYLDLTHRVFALDRDGWEAYAPTIARPPGWEVRISPLASGSTFVAVDPNSGIGFGVYPIFRGPQSPPDMLVLHDLFPIGLIPALTDESKREAEASARAALGSDYSVDVGFSPAAPPDGKNDVITIMITKCVQRPVP